MGCCLGKHKKELFGYRTQNDLRQSLLESQTLPPETVVVVIRLRGLDGVESKNALTGTSDPFAELRVIPRDPVAGEQVQRSTAKTDTCSPRWEPPERFQFIVSRLDSAKVILSAFHNKIGGTPEALGDAIIHLKDVKNDAVVKRVKIISPTNGRQKGEAEIEIQFMSPMEAASVQEHTIYEFQRFQPLILWGSSEGHFFPTDPGRWSTVCGRKFANDMEKVTPAVPEGWQVIRSWYTVATDADPDGWQYSRDFYAPYWFPKPSGATLCVRRRLWHRELAAPQKLPAATGTWKVAPGGETQTSSS